jgi:hypothetical protein
MWESRRANQFSRAVAKLANWKKGDAAELVLASQDISDLLALIVPDTVTDLPRGYKFVNHYAWRVLERNGKVFFTLAKNAADREDLGVLHEDLVSGLVQDIYNMLNEVQP